MPALGPKILLLAEDEPLIAMALSADLEAGGFQVLCVSDGDAAVKALDADVDRITCVITDIRMPGSVDGWDIGRYARHLAPDMPIVYMSGDQAYVWAEMGVPGSVMLAKPFAEAQLTTAVAQLINATPPAAPVSD